MEGLDDPEEIKASFQNLPERKQQIYQFLASYPEHLINSNREELIKAIDDIRKDFQKGTEEIAKELSKTSSRTAWSIAIFSLFFGFLLGQFSPVFTAVVSRACETISNKVSLEVKAPKTAVLALQSEEIALKRKSE